LLNAPPRRDRGAAHRGTWCDDRSARSARNGPRARVGWCPRPGSPAALAFGGGRSGSVRRRRKFGFRGGLVIAA